jgi:hypothetical protein
MRVCFSSVASVTLCSDQCPHTARPTHLEGYQGRERGVQPFADVRVHAVKCDHAGDARLSKRRAHNAGRAGYAGPHSAPAAKGQNSGLRRASPSSKAMKWATGVEPTVIKRQRGARHAFGAALVRMRQVERQNLWTICGTTAIAPNTGPIRRATNKQQMQPLEYQAPTPGRTEASL